MLHNPRPESQSAALRLLVQVVLVLEGQQGEKLGGTKWRCRTCAPSRPERCPEVPELVVTREAEAFLEGGVAGDELL
eukprot:1879149-Alexandrium_andersonii.AAC.1